MDKVADDLIVCAIRRSAFRCATNGMIPFKKYGAGSKSPKEESAELPHFFYLEKIALLFRFFFGELLTFL
ncbi:hypothetical protein EFP84_08145 [Leptospira kmetyi]|uniref:Uncharacterized protein n=1 Tax=Leptospira kmetyi TaxID=408139 RepID=A0AAD0UMB2_9LEPT|nr:hypothetical protein EFP84_08145 [Leptospira kmetyi]